MEKVKAVQDNSGHWYVIPAEMAEEFTSLSFLEDDEDLFIEKFSDYITGGDLNNIQLYADLS